jgi:hypothetical protein
MEPGTAAMWFLRVSCVEPLAAVQVSVPDTVHVKEHSTTLNYHN